MNDIQPRQNADKMLRELWVEMFRTRIQNEADFHDDFCERLKTGMTVEEQNLRREKLRAETRKIQDEIVHEYKEIELIKAEADLLQNKIDKLPTDKELERRVYDRLTEEKT